MHGWYSKKAADTNYTFRYNTPSGTVVTVTDVTPTTRKYSAWDDLVYIGEVTTIVSKKQPKLKGWLPG